MRKRFVFAVILANLLLFGSYAQATILDAENSPEKITEELKASITKGWSDSELKPKYTPEGKAEGCDGYFNQKLNDCMDVPSERRIFPSSSSENNSIESIGLLSTCTCQLVSNDMVCSGGDTSVGWGSSSLCPGNISGDLIIRDGCKVYSYGCNIQIGGTINIEEHVQSSRFLLYNSIWSSSPSDIDVLGTDNGDSIIIGNYGQLVAVEGYVATAGGISLGNDTKLSFKEFETTINGNIISGLRADFDVVDFTSDVFTVDGLVELDNDSSMNISSSDVVIDDRFFGDSGTEATISNSSIEIGNRFSFSSSTTFAVTNSSTITFMNPNYNGTRIVFTGNGDLEVLSSVLQCDTTCNYYHGIKMLAGGDMIIRGSWMQGFKTILHHEGDGDIDIYQNNFNNFWARSVEIENNTNFNLFRVYDNSFLLNWQGGTANTVSGLLVNNCSDNDTDIDIKLNDITALSGTSHLYQTGILLTNNTADMNVEQNFISNFSDIGINISSAVGEESLGHLYLQSNIVSHVGSSNDGILVLRENGAYLLNNWVWNVEDAGASCMKIVHSHDVEMEGWIFDPDTYPDFWDCETAIELSNADGISIETIDVAVNDHSPLYGISIWNTEDFTVGRSTEESSGIKIQGTSTYPIRGYAIYSPIPSSGPTSGIFHFVNIDQAQNGFFAENDIMTTNSISFDTGSMTNIRDIALEYEFETDGIVKYLELSGYTGGNVGIVAQTAEVDIHDNNITGFLTGIEMKGDHRYSTIHNNVIQTRDASNSTGILVDGGPITAAITCNTISSCQIGIRNTPPWAQADLFTVGNPGQANKIVLRSDPLDRAAYVLDTDPMNNVCTNYTNPWLVHYNWVSIDDGYTGLSDVNVPLLGCTGYINVTSHYTGAWNSAYQANCQ